MQVMRVLEKAASLLVAALIFTVIAALPVAAAQVSVAWDASPEPDVTGFKVHWGTASRSYGSNADVGDVTSYTVTGLADGGTYYFAATAYDLSLNESGYSVEIFTTLPPSAPLSLAATDGIHADRVDLAWQDVSGETGYTVFRSASAGGSYAPVGSAGAGSVAFSDPVACGGTVYYYKVRADNSGGSSPLSDAESGFTADCPPPPPPTGVAASDGTATDAVDLSWNASVGADEYQVFRADSAAGAKTTLGGWGTGLAYRDNSANPGDTYYYWVKSRNAYGESGYGGPDSGYAALPPETVAAPDAPSGPSSGFRGMSYAFSVSGGSSSYGDPLQYRVDWGDGSFSPWLSAGTTTALKTWDSSGTYSVRTRARCVQHPGVESDWSAGSTVAITVDTTPPAPPVNFIFSALP